MEDIKRELEDLLKERTKDDLLKHFRRSIQIQERQLSKFRALETYLELYVKDAK